ncbi:MAG: hypothetical protein K5644_10030 [Lachnospiraceae bacterium]|nr:hypothetical protein [Lachnospiraceae bacterium]
MNTLYGRSGIKYQLGNKIGAGGEGSVYLITSNSSKVAKVFHEGKCNPETMRRKIETMISMPIKSKIDGILRMAWPEDILLDGNTFVGYVMPYVTAPYEIFQVYRDDADRNRFLPDYTWKYSVQYAYNLSWIVWYMHLNGIVIGDMNMKNIHINEKGQVVLIDCDSFDITNPKTREHFPCTVGIPEMLAPELQSVRDLSKGKFSKESDDFSLAIHIFRLLMKNADPFGAKLISRRKSSRSSVNASDAIVNGECVYVRNISGKEAPDWVPPFEMLPEEVRDAFAKTFNYTALTALRNAKNRTTAEEWNRILLKYAKAEPNPYLKKCSNNPRHIYPIHNVSCPWCSTQNLIHDNGMAKTFRSFLGY